MKKRILQLLALILIISSVLCLPYYALTVSLEDNEVFAYSASNVDWSSTDLYYDQLEEDMQKEIYNNIVAMTAENCTYTLEIENPETTVDEWSDYVSNMISDIITPAFEAAVLDRPELFWARALSFSSKYSGYYSGEKVTISEIDITVKVTLYSDFIASEYETYQAEIDRAAASCVITGTTRYEKIKQIHDWICNHVTYDLNAPYQHTIYASLVKGAGVCDSYANLFRYFCAREKIPCILVNGTSISKAADGSRDIGGHAWNYVRMEDGKWYAMDVTWDDTTNTTDFFLRGSDSDANNGFEMTFIESHIPKANRITDSSFTIVLPELSKTEYQLNSGESGDESGSDESGSDESDPSESGNNQSSSNESDESDVSNESDESETNPPDPDEPIQGDVDGNGSVEAKDYLKLKRFVLGTYTATDAEKNRMDVNKDGNINAKDYLMLKRVVLGTYSFTK